MYRIPVLKAFDAPNALNHLGIKPARSQKRRNRVKRTERGRQTLTPHLPHYPSCRRFWNHHSGTQGPLKIFPGLSSVPNLFISGKQELRRDFRPHWPRRNGIPFRQGP